MSHASGLLSRATRLALVVAIAGAVAAASAPARANSGREAAARGAAYLVTQQAQSGAFFSAAQPADGTAEVVAALVAAAGDAGSVSRALDHIAAVGPQRARGRAGWAGRIVAGIVAADGDPRAFRGVDYVEILNGFYDPVTGRHDSGVYGDALAKLGLLAAREPLPERALTYLELNQCPNGGFAHEQGCVQSADVDSTAIVISVFTAAGRAPSDATVAKARAFLLSARNPDGGFGHVPETPTNANSTGLALSAIAGLGEDPARAPWARDGKDPVRALSELQLAGGSFRFRAADERGNDYATVQAIAGLSGRPYPIRPMSKAAGRNKPRDVSDVPSGTAAPSVAASVTPTPSRDPKETRPARTAGTTPPVATHEVAVPAGRATSRAPFAGAGAAAALGVALAHGVRIRREITRANGSHGRPS